MIPIKLIFEGFRNLILDKISDIKYKDIFNERRKICAECEFNSKGKCTVCGCFIKAKTMSENSRCLIGHWDTVEKTLQKRKEQEKS